MRPGDRLKGRVEILECRVSKSKPDLGFVRYNRYNATLNNQEGVGLCHEKHFDSSPCDSLMPWIYAPAWNVDTNIFHPVSVFMTL